jgi:hypothetical protein
VIVEVETDAERADRKTVLGLVIGLDEALEWSAHLWQAGQRVETTPIDELGNFVLSGLHPGAYELILARPELEIHIQHIQVGDLKGDPQESEHQ